MKNLLSFLLLLCLLICIVNTKKFNYRVMRNDNYDDEHALFCNPGRLFGKRVSLIDALNMIPKTIDDKAIEAGPVIQLSDSIGQNRIAEEIAIGKQEIEAKEQRQGSKIAEHNQVIEESSKKMEAKDQVNLSQKEELKELESNINEPVQQVSIQHVVQQQKEEVKKAEEQIREPNTNELIENIEIQKVEKNEEASNAEKISEEKTIVEESIELPKEIKSDQIKVEKAIEEITVSNELPKNTLKEVSNEENQQEKAFFIIIKGQPPMNQEMVSHHNSCPICMQNDPLRNSDFFLKKVWLKERNPFERIMYQSLLNPEIFSNMRYIHDKKKRLTFKH